MMVTPSVQKFEMIVLKDADLACPELALFG